MKLTHSKLQRLIKEELKEVFSSKEKKSAVKKLTSFLRSGGLQVSTSLYSRGLFEVGPSGFRVVIEDLKDGTNRSETGVVAKFPSLQSRMGKEKRTIWAGDLKTLAKKIKKYYKDFKSEHEVNDNQFENWIDVQVQQSSGTVRKPVNKRSL